MLTDTATIDLPGEVATHPPVRAVDVVRAFADAEAEYYARHTAPRRGRREWGAMSEGRRYAHIQKCEALCDRCREYRGGQTIPDQCAACGWVGDLQVRGDEARCPVCLGATYPRTED